MISKEKLKLKIQNRGTFHGGTLSDGVILGEIGEDGVKIDEIGDAGTILGIVGIQTNRISHRLLYLFPICSVFKDKMRTYARLYHRMQSKPRGSHVKYTCTPINLQLMAIIEQFTSRCNIIFHNSIYLKIKKTLHNNIPKNNLLPT